MEILRAAGADVRLCLPFEVDKEYELPRDLRFHRLDRELPGADAAICFGGDGTILHLAKLAALNKVPVLGINMGGYSLAVELASKVVKKEIQKKDHEALFEQFIDELGEKL